MLIATAATAAAASIGTAPAPRPPDAALVRSVEAVLFDCDGVIYANKRAVPGVPETLARLRGAGKRLFFVTNAAAASRESTAAKLGEMGIGGVQPEECLTSAWASAAYLATHHPTVRRAYVVGQDGLLDELRARGIEPVGMGDVGGLEALHASGGLEASLPIDAVVVGQQFEDLCYMRLAKASAYARDRNRPFVGTSPDASVPLGESVPLPAGGCPLAYVAHAAERAPDAVCGKPNAELGQLAAELFGLKPESTLMVGDRLNTDVAFGRAVGWRTMLVLTGCHGLADVERAPPSEVPHYVAQSVADLAACI